MDMREVFMILSDIFDDISFSIHEGDKIGVIGVNGTGKSTLLKIIAGVDQADSGTIVTMNGMRIGYLSQSPVFVDGTTVLQQVFRGENPQLALVREYEETMAALAKTPEEERLVKRAAELAEKMDKAEAWSLESEAKTILTKLGISDFGQTVETLSGGQKKRVALAAALIAPVDLLILDEPTNHIDNDTVDWLEKHLEKYSKALLMVTHDRYFLEPHTGAGAGQAVCLSGELFQVFGNEGRARGADCRRGTQAAEFSANGAGMGAPRRAGEKHQAEGKIAAI